MIIVNTLGVALIVLVIWWFWLYKPQEVKLSDADVVITVEDGVYQPANILLSQHHPVRLTLLRKDPSPCAETFLIPDLEISRTLPLNKPLQLTIPALDSGDYAFHCQMQMYRGEIKVR